MTATWPVEAGAHRSGLDTLLEVQDLLVRFRTHDGTIHAVNGVSFELARGERLGLVGESGCGKSVTNLAIIRLLPKPAGRIEGGSVTFDGEDLVKLSESELRDIRGRDIAMIFQDPMTSLNPVLTVEEQMIETIQAHRKQSKGDARARAVELLGMVGIPQPDKRLRSFPHQFSGGMRQRVMIAMALALEPKLLIADEPTTALDVTIQAQVLELISRLTTETGTSLILITHDLGVVAGMTDRINVMYAGFIVETAPTPDLFERPSHPYTVGPVALDAPGGPGRGRAADPDRGSAAGHAARANRLPVRTTLRVAPGPVLDREPRARFARPGHGHRDRPGQRPRTSLPATTPPPRRRRPRAARSDPGFVRRPRRWARWTSCSPPRRSPTGWPRCSRDHAGCPGGSGRPAARRG